MKILITGGAGFIGSNAANIFASEGHEVVALDNFSLGSKNHIDPLVHVVTGDVTNPHDMSLLKTPDVIIHLAASSSAPMFADDLAGSFSNNIMGHIRVLEFARERGVKKIIFASTSSVYGNNPLPLTEEQTVSPPNFYSVTKHTQENISRIFSRRYGIEIIAFRFMSVYGTHEEHKGKFANVLTQFIWGMEQGKNPLVYGDGTQTRDFTHVRDIVEAFRLALETPKQFGFAVFNVGTAQKISVNAVIATINNVMGTDYKPSYVPNPIKEEYIAHQQADLAKINKELGYQSKVSLEEGVRDIIEYRKKNPITPVSLSF